MPPLMIISRWCLRAARCRPRRCHAAFCFDFCRVLRQTFFRPCCFHVFRHYCRHFDILSIFAAWFAPIRCWCCCHFAALRDAADRCPSFSIFFSRRHVCRLFDISLFRWRFFRYWCQRAFVPDYWCHTHALLITMMMSADLSFCHVLRAIQAFFYCHFCRLCWFSCCAALICRRFFRRFFSFSFRHASRAILQRWRNLAWFDAASITCIFEMRCGVYCRHFWSRFTPSPSLLRSSRLSHFLPPLMFRHFFLPLIVDATLSLDLYADFRFATRRFFAWLSIIFFSLLIFCWFFVPSSPLITFRCHRCDATVCLTFFLSSFLDYFLRLDFCSAARAALHAREIARRHATLLPRCGRAPLGFAIFSALTPDFFRRLIFSLMPCFFFAWLYCSSACADWFRLSIYADIIMLPQDAFHTLALRLRSDDDAFAAFRWRFRSLMISPWRFFFAHAISLLIFFFCAALFRCRFFHVFRWDAAPRAFFVVMFAYWRRHAFRFHLRRCWFSYRHAAPFWCAFLFFFLSISLLPLIFFADDVAFIFRRVFDFHVALLRCCRFDAFADVTLSGVLSISLFHFRLRRADFIVNRLPATLASAAGV